jgi:hypothetical protein
MHSITRPANIARDQVSYIIGTPKFLGFAAVTTMPEVQALVGASGGAIMYVD